jgi:hypothetical protein
LVNAFKGGKISVQEVSGAMATLPKLKITKWTGEEEIQEIQGWEKFPFDTGILVVVEGQGITSYEELLKLAGREPYKDQKVLDVRVLPFIAGG